MTPETQQQAQHVDRRPRYAPNADAPGSYTPVIRLETQIVDPGEAVAGDMFFTGYGKIVNAKLLFYPATQIFETAGCVIEGRTLEAREGSNEGEFVIRQYAANDSGAMIQFPVWLQPAGGIVDYFFQAQPDDAGTLQLHTEGVTRARPHEHDTAPVTFNLKTRKTARPGTYPLTFVFTYFNGTNWLTVTQVSTFTVRNVLQRNETGFGIAAVAAAVATVAAALFTAIDTWDKVIAFAVWLFKSVFPPL